MDEEFAGKFSLISLTIISISSLLLHPPPLFFRFRFQLGQYLFSCCASFPTATSSHCRNCFPLQCCSPLDGTYLLHYVFFCLGLRVGLVSCGITLRPSTGKVVK
ncbi:hypothetical protein, unlikely [Trypanosoma brucei gambiense DAL972]|uniref:Uncharacterized protein n=1 Tax=Trypanosoma brucei gambiense (strain MHOM/CI/86/DAL972) TaxID=679716 RepID=D0A785_TRYB9|nr:hypothetical protein, unlikely [Trypanosoma brucei gambiense DAL972]CBH17536.1 hypothetical protein, unlikely [Trypanosoma brucei gambiense DAL972]|eukprot:XP_011779800.1 hypothetical protein, unlikely [Trypanosoma brucei gambiense DAL972]